MQRRDFLLGNGATALALSFPALARAGSLDRGAESARAAEPTRPELVAEHASEPLVGMPYPPTPVWSYGGRKPAGLGFAHRARSCAVGLGGALLALIGSALPIAANAEAGIDGTLTRLANTDLAVVARGERVYAENCASCHGVALEGQPDWRRRDANGLLPAPPHDASGHTWHHADDLLFEIVKYGPARVIDDPTYRSAMPAYESILSDDDIVAALSWIKSRWPAEEREWQEEVNRGQIGEDAASEAAQESLLERLFK